MKKVVPNKKMFVRVDYEICLTEEGLEVLKSMPGVKSSLYLTANFPTKVLKNGYLKVPVLVRDGSVLTGAFTTLAGYTNVKPPEGFLGD